MNVKILNKDGNSLVSWAAAGIKYAVDSGADVLNCSWGFTPEDPTAVVEEGVDYAYLQGCVIVASAGNENVYCKRCPAWMKRTITVAATNYADERANYSSWGTIVDIAAPGGQARLLPSGELVPDILSLRHPRPVKPYNLLVPWNDPAGRYRLMCGTSMAAPVVSGTAALILSLRPAINIEELRQSMRTTAVDRGAPGFDDYYGFGRLDAKAALDYAMTGYACRSLVLEPKDRQVYYRNQGGNVVIYGVADGTYARFWGLAYANKSAPSNWTWVAYDLEKRPWPYGGYLCSIPVSQLPVGEYLLRLTVFGYYYEPYYDYVSITVVP
jgi:subtilisin family serine protease